MHDGEADLQLVGVVVGRHGNRPLIFGAAAMTASLAGCVFDLVEASRSRHVPERFADLRRPDQEGSP